MQCFTFFSFLLKVLFSDLYPFHKEIQDLKSAISRFSWITYVYQCPSNFQHLCDHSAVVSSASREFFTILFCYFFCFGRGGGLGVQFMIRRYINTTFPQYFFFFSGYDSFWHLSPNPSSFVNTGLVHLKGHCQGTLSSNSALFHVVYDCSLLD